MSRIKRYILAAFIGITSPLWLSLLVLAVIAFGIVGIFLLLTDHE
jgi:hypothetical protein